jgi:hypothetical protein
MRIKDTLKLTLGSLAVYYVMAACSAPAGTSSAPSASRGTPGSSGTSAGASSGAATAGASSGGTTGASSGSGTSNGSPSGSSGSPVPDANADETQSGSRLRANYFSGADGSKQFAYFTDAQRGNEQCSFGAASDGSIRCLPTGAEMGSYYADASCSVPLALATCGAAPAYGASYGAAACGLGQRTIYPVTGAFGGTTFYAGTSSACSALTKSDLPATYSLYSVGTPLAPSSFQLATMTVQ